MDLRATALEQGESALTYALVYIGDQVRELVGQREVIVIDDRSDRPGVPSRLLDSLLRLEKAVAELCASRADEIDRKIAMLDPQFTELRSAVDAVARARSVVEANETAVEWARSVGRDVKLEDGEVRPSVTSVCSCERSDAEMRVDETPAVGQVAGWLEDGGIRFAEPPTATVDRAIVERLREERHEIRTTATALLWEKRSMMPEHSEEIIEDVLDVVEAVLDDSAS